MSAVAADSPSSDARATGAIQPPPLETISSFRAALRDAFDWAAGEPQQWNALVALAAYELAALRGLRPTELCRLRMCDVSLQWDVILIPHPKATRRGADSRVVHLGPYLRQYVEPLVRALRHTGQDEARVLCQWAYGGLQPLRPGRLATLAATLTSWPLEAVPAIGLYRHVYATRREQLDSDRGRSGGSYIRFRRSSASMGHGQSGGWSIHLPNQFDDERRILDELDTGWGSSDPLKCPLRLPPQVRQTNASNAWHRVARDWATVGLEQVQLELDRLPLAHQRLWSFSWVSALGIDHKRALSCAAFIQLVGFSEALAPLESVLRLRWQDITGAGDGLQLSFVVPNVIGRLCVWVGRTERLLFECLSAAGAASPFADLDRQLVDRVVRWMFGINVSISELAWGNQVVHLMTHDFQQVGYLQGRIGAKVKGSENRLAVPKMVLPRANPLRPLLKDLRRSAGRLTLAELDRRLDAVLSEWRSWSTADSESLTPAVIIAALRTCCSSALRSRGRRSRSVHTLRWLLEILCQVALIIGDRPVASIDRSDLDRLVVGKKKEHLAGPAIHWLRLACTRLGIPQPKRFRFHPQQRIQPMELPAVAELVSAEELFEGDERLLVKLIFLACTVARKAEIGCLCVQDVRLSSSRLFVGVRQAKGGHRVWRHARIPSRLRPLIHQFSDYLINRDRDSRLIAPLAHRSQSTDAIFRRISYRLSRVGVRWSPHLMRTIGATAAAEAGIDRAEISARLGHVRVDTAASSYIILDSEALRASANKLAEAYSVRLSTFAIAWLFGVSNRQAQRLHAKTSLPA